jgi:hypothetical protein
VAKKSTEVSRPILKATPALVVFAKGLDARVRMDIIRKLTSDLELLRKDEMRLRRSRKRDAKIDLAVISGQMLGIRQAIDAVTRLVPDWTMFEREALK